MSSTTATLITPSGSSAIAVIAVDGPEAWIVLRELFRPFGPSLPDPPTWPHFWFGRLGMESTDEVILTSWGSDRFEIHCHGGQRVVRWLLSLLEQRGIANVEGKVSEFADPIAARLLPHAATLRTASILLDQARGAFVRAQQIIERGDGLARETQAVLDRNAEIGRHLVVPWKVALLGAPNAGKSTLFNAMVGYDRSIVSPIAGTTRDSLHAIIALDGWPLELIDTAGLRDSSDTVEIAGVARSRQVAIECDLALWLIDASDHSQFENRPGDLNAVKSLRILTKCDIASVNSDAFREDCRVSATTGEGLQELISRIVAMLVPNPPKPGEAVPIY